MLKRLFIYFLIGFLCTAVAAALVPLTTDDGTALQKQLDAGWRNFVPNGPVPAQVGTIVNVPAGLIVLKAPLKIGSMTTLNGAGRSATIIEWDGSRGTSAVLIGTGQGHGTVYRPEISNLAIYCPKGASAVGLDSTAQVVERPTFISMIFHGGGINLPGKHYFASVRDSEFIWPTGQMIRFDGLGGIDLSGCHFDGPSNANFKPNGSLVEVHGQLTLSNRCRFEATYDAAQIEVHDLSNVQGAFSMGGDNYIECHRPSAGPDVIMMNTDCVTTFFGGTERNPWQQLGRSRVFSARGITGVVSQ